jgi:outer membrane protein
MVNRYALLAAVLLMANGSPAAAQLVPPSAPKVDSANQRSDIAIVNRQIILRDSLAAKSVRSQIDQLNSKYKAEFQKLEQELRAADEDLNRQRAALPREQFETQRRALQDRAEQLQRAVQNRKRDVDQAYNGGMEEIAKAVAQIVFAVAKERDASVVLDSATVIMFERALDVTKEVMTRLDKQLPSVKVSEAGSASPAAAPARTGTSSSSGASGAPAAGAGTSRPAQTQPPRR